MPTPDPVQSAAGRLAYYSRRDADPVMRATARRDFLAAKLEQHIQEVVDAAPPLSQQQREHLSSLLTGGAL